MNFEITRSLEREDDPHIVQLDNDVKLVSYGPVNFFKRDFFPASFMFQSDDVVAYIDPLGIDSVIIADYIFITHDHLDHFYLPDIAKISDENTLIIGPKRLTKKLENYNFRLVKPGEKFDIGGITCETFPAYSKGMPTHPKRSEYVSYVLTINGNRIFHAGDSDLIPELARIKDIDVALIPIDGGQFAMKTEEATKLINTMKPKKAIPMHFEIYQGEAVKFRRLVNESIEVILLEE
jgi:L-ascorbate metabolism protein UlaG (beta-lactamase superfamily)